MSARRRSTRKSAHKAMVLMKKCTAKQRRKAKAVTKKRNVKALKKQENVPASPEPVPHVEPEQKPAENLDYLPLTRKNLMKNSKYFERSEKECWEFGCLNTVQKWLNGLEGQWMNEPNETEQMDSLASAGTLSISDIGSITGSCAQRSELS